jgi:hypothetical protein
MLHYKAFGLRISSDIPLPELPVSAADSEYDLALRFNGVACDDGGATRWLTRIEASTREPWLCCGRTSRGYLLRFPGIADLLVAADARSIECTAAHVATDDPTLRHLVLDHVMPLVLKLRGWEALHATAVNIDGRVCALIGPSGIGKSTLAAAFLRAGYGVLSDDCLRLFLCDGRAYVAPSYPGVRLSDEGWAVFAEADSVAPPVGTFKAKRRWAPPRAFDSFSHAVRPLDCIYRLDRAAANDSGISIEPLTVRGAFMELVASTFRFDALDRGMLTAEFEIWAQVAQTVPVRRLVLDGDLRGERTRARIVEDLLRF